MAPECEMTTEDYEVLVEQGFAGPFVDLQQRAPRLVDTTSQAAVLTRDVIDGFFEKLEAGLPRHQPGPLGYSSLEKNAYRQCPKGWESVETVSEPRDVDPGLWVNNIQPYVAGGDLKIRVDLPEGSWVRPPTVGALETERDALELRVNNLTAALYEIEERVTDAVTRVASAPYLFGRLLSLRRVAKEALDDV